MRSPFASLTNAITSSAEGQSDSQIIPRPRIRKIRPKAKSRKPTKIVRLNRPEEDDDDQETLADVIGAIRARLHQRHRRSEPTLTDWREDPDRKLLRELASFEIALPSALLRKHTPLSFEPSALVSSETGSFALVPPTSHLASSDEPEVAQGSSWFVAALRAAIVGIAIATLVTVVAALSLHSRQRGQRFDGAAFTPPAACLERAPAEAQLRR